MKKILKYASIVVVIIWMVTVFVLSSETGAKSENTSNNFTKSIFKNNISEEQIKSLSFIIRKTAHFILYTIGGICICLCVLLNFRTTSKIYLLSFIIGSSYAMSDEIHQLFIPNRSGQIRDVIIDSLGVLFGIVIIKFSRYIIYKLKESD